MPFAMLVVLRLFVSTMRREDAMLMLLIVFAMGSCGHFFGVLIGKRRTSSGAYPILWRFFVDSRVELLLGPPWAFVIQPCCQLGTNHIRWRCPP